VRQKKKKRRKFPKVLPGNLKTEKMKVALGAGANRKKCFSSNVLKTLHPGR